MATLQPSDRARWSALWRAYLTFYSAELSSRVYESTWRRIVAGDGPVYGLCIRVAAENGGVVIGGIAHYILHASAWTAGDICYLQDLFIAPEFRRRGYARSLIEAVAEVARARSCEKLYWLTQETNHEARALYESCAAYDGFLRYDYPLRS